MYNFIYIYILYINLSEALNHFYLVNKHALLCYQAFYPIKIVYSFFLLPEPLDTIRGKIRQLVWPGETCLQESLRTKKILNLDKKIRKTYLLRGRYFAKPTFKILRQYFSFFGANLSQVYHIGFVPDQGKRHSGFGINHRQSFFRFPHEIERAPIGYRID